MASVPNTTSTITSQPKAFSVAVIGGGIGGLALAIGLLKYPHIDVQVYEAAPTFGEIGAGVALGPNAQRGLELIDPAAKEAFEKHATGNMWNAHANTFADFIVGTKGKDENRLIHAQKNATGMRSVHRAHFLQELVRLVPAQRAHFNKRLETIEDRPGNQVIMHFKDGTTATADTVIGADGVHSPTREHIMGKEAAAPIFAKATAYRGLVSMDAAVEKLGAERAQNTMILCGPGKAIMSYPIDHGTIFNVVGMDYEHEQWEHEKWIVPAKYEELERLWGNWGEVARHQIELLDTPNLAVWAMCEAPMAPYYNKHRVCMMGDAAHATTPFQGQGAGQAIEDALVLTHLLGTKVADEAQIPNAFAAYDQIRRPRSQKVITTSREAGYLMGMMQEGVGGDLDKMSEQLEKRMKWIWQRDLGSQNYGAAKLFEESL